MNKKELEFHRDRCKKLLNGESYETYHFAPAEIQNFLSLIERLQQENKELHKKSKATEKGLNKVLFKRKKWKNRYYKEKRKNKQLEQALNEIIEYIKSWTVYECDKNTVRELSFESSKEDVLQIIGKYKGSDS